MNQGQRSLVRIRVQKKLNKVIRDEEEEAQKMLDENVRRYENGGQEDVKCDEQQMPIKEEPIS